MQKFTMVFSAITLLAAGAIADQHTSGDRLRHHDKFGAMIFNKLDADNDHRVSASEFDRFHEQRFARMDADSDGFLTQAEINTHHRHMRDQRRAKYRSESAAP